MRKTSVVIVVENLPVPFDTRVWSEATTLAAHGYQVAVICPRTKAFPARREHLDGVDILRHDLPIEADGALGFVLEYGLALFWELVLLTRLRLGRRIDIIQLCNPPDFLVLAALPFRLLGARIIFDHHDLCPELYEAKYDKRGFMHAVLRAFERLTFAAARVSIATNESYKEIAVSRGAMDPGDVYVVRSGPRLDRLTLARPQTEADVAAIKKGAAYLVGYVGVIGRQEGLSYLVEAARILRDAHGRSDVAFAIVGSGPDLERVRQEAEREGVSDLLRFYGRLSDADMVATLSACDVCVNADAFNTMNDLSTMNKIMEYMALSKPIVQFDLKEGRRSALDASLYAKPNDAADMAACILALLNDPEARARMGAYGRARVVNELAWPHQIPVLLRAYEAALGDRRSGAQPRVSDKPNANTGTDTSPSGDAA